MTSQQQIKKRKKELPQDKNHSSTIDGSTSPIPTTQPQDTDFYPLFTSPGSDLTSPVANLTPGATTPNSGIKTLLESEMSPRTKADVLNELQITIEIFT